MEAFGSGFPAIDTVCRGVLEGDNVVWRTGPSETYREVSRQLLRRARQLGRPAVYFRFSSGEPLFGRDELRQLGGVYRDLHPEQGFEQFLTGVHGSIREFGGDAAYVFDSLSNLRDTSFSDGMIAAFFRLTCPFLRKVGAVAYFCLEWGIHSAKAIDPIRKTTQVWVDCYLFEGTSYLQAIKTREDQPQLHNGTLFRWRGGDSPADPVRNSAMESQVRKSVFWSGLPSSPVRQVDGWDQLFVRFRSIADQVDALQQSGESFPEGLEKEHRRVRRQAIRMIMTNDERMAELVEREVPSADILEVWRRMIGSGFIGGKAVGMVLAQAALRNHAAGVRPYLEAHDSFYIGSDTFYTYLVDNDCWWDRREQLQPDKVLSDNERVAQRIMQGQFSPETIRIFEDLLDYFGGSPLIVRSSSLMEDNFGNAFAGKYESIFCTNQGGRKECLDAFCTAVRKIYAGTMGTEALEYRRDRGVLDRDEQMALLVQRVSGRRRNRYFFPDLAGTVTSYNPYPWHPEVSANSGVVRLVLGLGTRAVDRVAEDFPWVASLSAPQRRPPGGEEPRFQNKIDLLDLDGPDDLTQVSLSSDPESGLDFPDFLFRRDWRQERSVREAGLPAWHADLPDCENALSNRGLGPILKEAADCLRKVYGTEVELEFTAQWGQRWDSERTHPWVNIVQCRPYQVRIGGGTDLVRPEPADESLILRVGSPIIGRGRKLDLGALVWIDPESYAGLGTEGQLQAARELGQFLRGLPDSFGNVALFGPGRWGTGISALGVPVRFGDIRRAQVLGEMDWMHKSLRPDLSLGTHFFHDLVEADMLFLGIRKEDPAHILRLPKRCGLAGIANCIRYLPENLGEGKSPWKLYADPEAPEAFIYAENS